MLDVGSSSGCTDVSQIIINVCSGGENTLHATQSVSSGILFAPHLDLQDGQVEVKHSFPYRGYFIVFEESVDIHPPNGAG